METVILPKNNFIIRCRGIILYKDKLLVVKHGANDKYYALPGGHLEFGEDTKDCMIREIEEELGIKPVLGNLLYIHSYKDGRKELDMFHSLEFFFEIKNGIDYLDCEKIKRTHAHELAEIRWISKEENVNLLPIQILDDFKNDKLISVTTRFTEGT